MGLLITLARAGKGAVLHTRTALVKTLCLANRLRKGLGSSGVLSLQAALIAGNVLFFTAGGQGLLKFSCMRPTFALAKGKMVISAMLLQD